MARSSEKYFSLKESAGLLCCIGVAAAMIAGHWGYTIDDTFIYAQFAKNILAGNGMSFNAGEAVYGFTSPLWLWLVTLLGFCGTDLILATKILGAISTCAAIAIFFVAARRWLADERVVFIVTLVWATNAWLLRWSVCGIEAPLAVAVIIAAMHSYAVERANKKFRWSPVLLGIAALTRPEAGLLGIIFLADMLVIKPRVTTRQLFFFCAVAGIVVAPWLIIAWTTFHTLIPTTFAAKADQQFSLRDVAMNLYRSAKILGATSVVEMFVIAAMIVPSWRRRIVIPKIFLVWIVALPLMYAAVDADVLSRYLLMIIPAIIFVGWKVISTLLKMRIGKMAFAICCVSVLCENQFALWCVVKPHTRGFEETINGSLIPMGKWLHDHTPQTAIIAMPDIGAVGYYADRKILDLNRIVTPQLHALWPAAGYNGIVINALYLSVARPDYLIDKDSLPARLLANTSPPLFDTCSTWRVPTLDMTSGEQKIFYTIYKMRSGGR